jgi:hypothetical protein
MISIDLKDNNLVIENQIITWNQACKRVCFYGSSNIIPKIEDVCREVLTTWALNNGATLMRSDIMLDYIKLLSMKSQFNDEYFSVCDYGQFIFMYCYPVFEEAKAHAEHNGCYPSDFRAIERLWNHSREAGCPSFMFCIGSSSGSLNPWTALTHIDLGDCLSNPSNLRVRVLY